MLKTEIINLKYEKKIDSNNDKIQWFLNNFFNEKFTSVFGKWLRRFDLQKHVWKNHVLLWKLTIRSLQVKMYDEELVKPKLLHDAID